MIDKVLKLMPIAVFYIVTGINFLLMFGGLSDEIFRRYFYVFNELFGNSLIFNFTLLIICIKYRVKTSGYLAAIGLILTNLINLAFMFFPIGWNAYLELTLLGVLVPFTALVTGFILKRI